MRLLSVYLVGVLAFFAATMVAGRPLQPKNPVVGIITHPLNQCPVSPPADLVTNACVESYYVRWLESAGIRVVAVPHNATFERQKWFLDRINGVLFQGGGLGGDQEQLYINMATKILDYAVERNAGGDPFVVWGTCQGFQVISAWAAGQMAAIEGTYHGMYPLMMPINFTTAQARSRLFGDAATPRHVLDYLTNYNSTLNWHHDIVKPSAWQKYPTMQALLTPLSTNFVPNSNVEFVSSMESPIAEIYATQFHPERPPYSFTNDNEGHNARDIAVSQYLADFVASKVRRNNHTFDTPEQYEENRIGQWPLVDSGWGERTYFTLNVNNE